MTAATKDRATPERDGRCFGDPLAPGVTIHAGTMYVFGDADGLARPAGSIADAGDSTQVFGVALNRASATDGDTHVDGGVGVYRFENDAAPNAVTRAHIGVECYIKDDQTVTADAITYPKRAGLVVDVDDAGVWVHIQRDAR